MSRRKKIPDPILMLVSILAIAGFQAYWLKQNYDREEKTLAIKTEVAFRETLRKLQAKKLKLENIDSLFSDPVADGNTRVFVSSKKKDSFNVRIPGKEEIVSTLNIVRNNWKDSLALHPEIKGGMVISLDESSFTGHPDSLLFPLKPSHVRGARPDNIIRFLYGVDSLQDSIRVKEIELAYGAVLKDQKINIPFTVLRLDSNAAEEPGVNEVSVGILHPITYRLQTGSNIPYLLKRIASPVLFSVFLVGLTILSFVLLFRNLKKQQRLAELKNDFISNITHELKTPIATVGVAIEALKNFNAMQSPERTKEYLDISSNELQRLNLLVDKVLKLSMFEKKEIELNPETLNLKDLADEVIASMRLQSDKKNAKVTLNHSGNLLLRGDRLHLLSVIFNLVDNAIKYSNENPVIKIDLEEKENDLVLKVTDNGTGIPPEYSKKIFEKFFRMPSGNTHNTKGYGLGLSYVSHVVNRHNGKIEVESEPGKGSTFIITLPKAPVP
jgi:two-component system, OmpR family, phosphate regulon sensor histidine kinase PhoR